MNLKTFLTGIAVGVLAAIPASASTIDLGINGDAQVGPNFINFGNYPTGTTYTPAPGYGVFVVSQPPLGIFLSGGVTAGESGKIQSLNATVTPPGAMLTPDPLMDSPFMTFDTGGANLRLFLTELVPGATTGPFSLYDTPNGAVASFSMDGFVFDTTDDSREDITGTFSATFNGISAAELISEEQGGTVIQTPFSGTFSIAAVPESSSLTLVGVGLLGAGLISRRKVRRLSSVNK